MNIKKYRHLASLGAVLVGSGILSCDEIADSPLGDCLPKCEVKLIAEGNGAVTGLASFDAFFGAVAKINAKAKLIGSAVGEAQARMALLVGATGTGGAEIGAAFKAKVNASTQGGVQITFKPPKCQASVEATVEASARCDADVSTGSASVQCSGSCEVSASAEASCDANAEVVCKGTAPELKCSGVCNGECSARVEAGGGCTGSCSGSCSGTCTVNLEAAATCDGVCKGSCSGSTDAGGRCDGDCKGGCELSGDAAANCTGTCDGTCSGECSGKLEADGSCKGQCKGECEFTPPEASCSAGAKVECKASANAEVECNGKCTGEVTPPSAKVECQASAKAEAKAEASCTPPNIGLEYTFQASADFATEAEFEAFLNVFFEAYGDLLAQGALIGELTGAVEGLIDARGDVLAKLQADFEAAGSGNILLAAQLGCGVDAIPAAFTVLGEAGGSLSASASAIGSLTTALN